jgi:NAD(P)H-flavin reductase
MTAVEAKQVTLEVVQTSELSPNVKSLTLRPIDHPEFRWVAGQYIELMVPGSAVTRQPYSIASIVDPHQPGCLEVAVLRGRDTLPLHELAVSDRLSAYGPLGKFTRARLPNGPALFVGSGTGLAPLRAMILDELRNPSSDSNLTLLFGARSEAELLWQDQLIELARGSRRFRFEPTLSQPSNSWSGRRGYVQHHFAELLASVPDAVVYVCGGSKMVEESVSRLERDHGISLARIVTERQ